MNATPPPPIDSERWERIEELFHVASELPEEERAAFLDRECGNDDALRASVERFLIADASVDAIVDGSLEDLASPLLADLAESVNAHLPPGTPVGRYRLLDVLGSGGMGTVYRAERADGVYERQVAIKMVRAGRLESVAEGRFERERRILGRLKHPGIATLVDGGVTEDGQAFLVMELVEGTSVTEFAKTRELGVAERVRLAIDIAEAVDYAHRNLVVHRDLKPSNILIDDGHTVKLLDFGIARLTEEEAGDAATRTGLLLLTPDYAAPEQIRGEAITTATDVYAIGAILYELLTLNRPFGRVTPKWKDLERVLNEAPPPLSRASGLDRSTRRALDGDLETIVQRALHKEPTRRYSSARALRDDLQRFLDGLPVKARPDSFGYRAQKFLQRNRVASVAGAAVIVAVLLGLAGTFWQARVAAVQAERRQAVGDFVLELFEGADPDLNPGDPMTVVELLEAGAARVDSLEAGPETRVDLLTTLGSLMGKLGRHDRSEALLRQAVSEARAQLAPADPAIGNALEALGIRLSATGNLEDSEAALLDALTARESSGAPSAEVASVEGNLAATLRNRGRYEEAAAIYERAVATLSDESDGDSLGFTSELMGLAQTYQFLDRLDEAEALFRSVRRLEESGGNPNPTLGFAIHNLGVVVAASGRPEEAERIHQDALAVWRALFPDGHPEVARSLESIGRVVALQGKWSEADSLYTEAFGEWSRVRGSSDTYLATIRANQANLRYRMGNFGAAASAYSDGVRIWRENGDQRLLSVGLRNLGVIQTDAGNLLAADTLLSEALELRKGLNGAIHMSVAETHSAIAGLRIEQGRPNEAQDQARIALEQYDSLVEPEHPAVLNTQLRLATALVVQGRFGEGRALLQPLHREFSASLNPNDVRVGRASLWLGIALDALGDEATGRRLVEEALPSLEAALRADSFDRRRAEAELRRFSR